MLRSLINIRFLIAIGISGLFVFRISTAHIPGIEGFNTGMTNDFVSSRLGNLPMSLTSDRNNSETPDLFKTAYQVQTLELIWSGKLSLERQANDTKTNVVLAAQAIDLTVLHPNEIFSFNQIVGIRTEEKGYQAGLMYSNGEVVNGIGGGICIVSTLLYKAVLESGMNILERHPHSGPVSYADPGRDAAIAYFSTDLRFKNNTEYLLFLRTKVEDDNLIVALYGKKKEGQSVEIVSQNYKEIPYKIIETEDETIPEDEVVVDQKARTGFEVTTIRLIRQNGKLINSETMSHDVVPAQNKLMRIPLKPQAETDMQANEPSILPDGEANKNQPIPATSGTINIPEFSRESSVGSSQYPSTENGQSKVKGENQTVPEPATSPIIP